MSYDQKDSIEDVKMSLIHDSFTKVPIKKQTNFLDVLYGLNRKQIYKGVL